MYTINSNKSISELVSSIRSKGLQLDMIPSDVSNGVRSSFAAVLHGSSEGMFGGRNEPGIKVVIYDINGSRLVDLEPLNASPMGQKFNIKKGEELCKQLYSELNEETVTYEPEPVAVKKVVAEPVIPQPAVTSQPISEYQPAAPIIPQPTVTPQPISEYQPAAPKVADKSLQSGTEQIKINSTASMDEGWRCTNCGKINRGDAMFCGECGVKKGGTVHAPSEPAKSSGNLKTVFIIVAILVVVLVAGLIVKSIMSSQSRINSYNDSEAFNDMDSEDDYDYNGNDSNDMDYYEIYDEYPDDAYDAYYKIGNTYKIKTNLRVRSGPGKNYRILNRDELSYEDYIISVDTTETTDALLEKGNKVICLGMQGDWMRINSGWICVYDEGEDLVR